MESPRVLVVVPALNEEEGLKSVLPKLNATGFDVLVVDDGSVDMTKRVCETSGVRCIRHVVNTGLGSALTTGFTVARREGFDVLVTFDADGQHRVGDLMKLVNPIQNKEADVAIGVRKINSHRMPAIKRLGNRLLNSAVKLIFGVSSSDSQSGLRAFNRDAIECIDLKSTRYEVSAEILFEAKKHGLRVAEIPIETVYTDYSRRKATGVMDGVRIFWRMLLHEKR